MSDRLLNGVRVCAFTHIAAGPYGAMQLAYLGAQVIKVETRTRMDQWRFRDRNVDPEGSRTFADHNKDVLGVTFNAKVAEGLDLIQQLISRCDVVIDNMSAGTLDRLGLGYDTLRELRDDIIVVHLSGLGSDGPQRHALSFGPTLMSLCGMRWMWTAPGSEVPIGSQSSYPDYVVGVYAAYAVLTALLHRRRTGEGALLDIAQAEVMAHAMAPSFVSELNGLPAVPVGNASDRFAPYGCYPCAGGDDAWCVIAVETDEQWAALRRLMGDPDTARSDRFDLAAGRLAEAETLDAVVTEWTLRHRPSEVMGRCQGVGVPAGIVASGEDLSGDAHLRARGFILERDHPVMGPTRLPGSPVRYRNHPVNVKRFGPILGGDNDYVLRDLLRLSSEQIDGYRRAGALQ